MGQPVASTTASLAVTCTHTRTLQCPHVTGLPDFLLGQLLCTAMAVTADSERFLVMGSLWQAPQRLWLSPVHTHARFQFDARDWRTCAFINAVHSYGWNSRIKEVLGNGQPVASTTASLAITCTHTHTLQLSRPTLPDLFLLCVCESKFQGSCIRCSFGHMAGSRTRLSQQILHACTCMVLLVSICKLHESQTNPSN